MSLLKKFDISSWSGVISKEYQDQAIQALEEGKVLYFPALSFSLDETEQTFLSPSILHPKSKNISYDHRSNKLGGSILEGSKNELLKSMIQRFSVKSRLLLDGILPAYKSHLKQGKTSFRPVEIEGRKTSYRKDDTLLHIDSFPSNPTKGLRILRIFANINHEGKPRHWRVGEPLEKVVDRFLSRVSGPIWGISHLLKWLKITKDYRTPYDHYMLGVHDTMKGDDHYQKTVAKEEIFFPPGSSWIVFTDQVSHAALSGQHVLEQTFYIPVEGLKHEHTSPLRVMERMLNKHLV